MLKKRLLASLTAVMMVGASLPALAGPMGDITGRVRAQIKLQDYQKEATSTKYSDNRIETDARFGYKIAFREGDISAGARIELDIDEDHAGNVIKHRDKYVYVQNESFKVMLGYAWSHLNDGYRGGKYLNWNYGAGQNTRNQNGVTDQYRAEALAISYRGLEDIDVKFLLGLGSDNEINWVDEPSKRDTNDLGLGFAVRLDYDAFDLKGTYHQYTETGNKKKSLTADGYERKTSMIAVGVQLMEMLGDIRPYLNYHLKVQNEVLSAGATALKTGEGYTHIELGADYALDSSGQGITVVYNTRTYDRDAGKELTENTIGIGYEYRISRFQFSAGYSQETNVTKSDTWVKDTRTAFGMLYNF